jgi:hypothetical protein
MLAAGTQGSESARDARAVVRRTRRLPVASRYGGSVAGTQKTAVMQTLRMLVGAVVAALFLMAVALSLVLGFAAPPWWTVVVLLVLGVGAHLTLDRVGYRVPAISPSRSAEEGRSAVVRAFQSSLMRRLAIAESVAIVGLLLAFAGGHTVLVYDLGAAISVLLLALHVWPSLRTIDRVVGGLERDGADTGLREMMGFGGTAGGAVTRLD